jgi:DNA-binding LacI/PurR family transcriptional regulator
LIDHIDPQDTEGGALQGPDEEVGTADRRPTMASVGRAAGVSRQTVWNVLHSPERVHPLTRKRVESTIRDQRYRPNRVARSLRTRAARLLGYCVMAGREGAVNPILHRFVHAITGAAEKRGYHILLFTAPAGRNGLATYADLLAERAVDGFILSDTTVGDPRQRWLVRRAVPFVAFGRSWSGAEHGSWVDVDGASGTAAAVDHLHEQGHQRTAFVGWPKGSGVGDDRLAGWAGACARHGLRHDLVARCEDSIEASRRLAAGLLDVARPPTALVCASDVLAMGCLAEVRARGLRPGHDVAVVGFDDTPFARLPGLDLSSVEQPIEDIGAEVVRLLVDTLGGTMPQPRQVLLEPSLRARSSSLGFRGGAS